LLVSATPKGLAGFYGLDDAAADDLYCQLASIQHGSVFFSPGNEARFYRPPINIADLTGEAAVERDAILADQTSVIPPPVASRRTEEK
jgi:hypothetical protein